MTRALAAGALALVLLASAATAGATERVLVNGDSLAVGTEPYLPGELDGWRIHSSTEVSRHAFEGPEVLRSFGRRLPRVIAVSLGTNDDPRQLRGFRAAVRETMDVAGSRRCVVWANVVRPPVEGVSYAGYNRALRRESRVRENLRVLDWARMVGEHPDWLARDGVHVSAEGYRARARATARAIRRCRRARVRVS